MPSDPRERTDRRGDRITVTDVDLNGATGPIDHAGQRQSDPRIVGKLDPRLSSIERMVEA